MDKPKKANRSSDEMIILVPVINNTDVIAYAAYVHIPTATLSEILLNSSSGNTGKSYLLSGGGDIICGSHLSEKPDFEGHSKHVHTDTNFIKKIPSFPDLELKLVPFSNYNNVKQWVRGPTLRTGI